ncbi:HAD family hydrolase [Haloarchaeobius amylolyticus]|uniref:HAD family hydrolase n=1 Tax=Haloarchaeobius amylolyticus TaxID=1198296 RepID=UPI0022715DF7
MTSEYDGVVYDLDGTLVRLDVDWEAVASDVTTVYREAGVSPDGRDLWGLFEDAPEHGLRDPVHEAIAHHEREGARTSDRLPLADALAEDYRPIAVCSLNCEAACHIALETHGLSDHVRAVVGRDTVATYKPHPEPLLTAVSAIDRHPRSVVFVGDSERDEQTARRAGTDFEWV